MDLICWKKNGGLFIPGHINKDWIIKVPTVKHRLNRSGTCSLKIAERYDLQTKAGILLVDSTAKAYVYIPKSILDLYEPVLKDFQGIKNSLIVYQVGKIIEEQKLEMVKIPNQSEPVEYSGMAGDIRKKFGL